MKSLITGGARFIGSNLVDRLVESNNDVTVLDNLSTGNIINLNKVKNKIKFLNVDITKNKLDDYFENIDQVFHLAGLADIVPSIKNPKAYFDVNLLGTMNVLEAAKNKQVKKCIYAASASCYGIPSDYPTNEKSKIDPKYPYALTKYLAEEVFTWKETHHALPYSVL